MEFKSLLEQLLTIYKSKDQIDAFISKINLLSPANKISLAQKVLDFQKQSMLINQSLSLVDAGWTEQDIKEAEQNIATASKLVFSSTRSADEDSLRLALNNTTVVDIDGEGKPMVIKPVEVTSTNVQESVNNNTMFLYNPWLNRLIKTAAIVTAVVAIAAVLFALYYYRDQLGSWAKDLYEKLSSGLDAIMNRTSKKTEKLAYPYDEDVELLAEYSKHAKMVMKMAEMLRVEEQLCISFLTLLKTIDVDKAMEYYRIEQRVKDVRNGYTDRRPVATITRQIEYAGR